MSGIAVQLGPRNVRNKSAFTNEYHAGKLYFPSICYKPPNTKIRRQVGDVGMFVYPSSSDQWQPKKRVVPSNYFMAAVAGGGIEEGRHYRPKMALLLQLLAKISILVCNN